MVDLSRHLPGPLATRQLADLGARVIKVEEPKLGDPVRQAPAHGAPGALAALLLAGVESVALDLKQPAARAVLLRLLKDADVLVESLRPGTLARLGLAPKELRALFPRLVICSISGFGQDGPLATRAGHDLTYQALAGALAAVPRAPAQPVADLVGAWSAVSAILAALWARSGTGQGIWIDAALLDAGVSANVMGWAAEAERKRLVGEALALSGASPCYGVYRTRDGHELALALLESRFWERFCELVGEKKLIARQFDNGPEAHRWLAEIVARHSREEWDALLAANDLPIASVLSAEAAATHPQTAARGMLGRGAEGFPRIGFPARFDGVRLRSDRPVPKLGENTEAVLAEWGLDAGLSARRRRAAGIGTKSSWRRWLLRWLSR